MYRQYLTPSNAKYDIGENQKNKFSQEASNGWYLLQNEVRVQNKIEQE